MLVGTAILKRIWFPYLGLMLFGPGLDAGARIVPFPWRWSPFLGLGGHASFKTLGLPHSEDEPVMVNEGEYTNEELFGKNLHLDAGVQYHTQVEGEDLHVILDSGQGGELILQNTSSIDGWLVQG